MGKQIISFLVITSAYVLVFGQTKPSNAICQNQGGSTALTAGSWKKRLKDVSGKSACREDKASNQSAKDFGKRM